MHHAPRRPTPSLAALALGLLLAPAAHASEPAPVPQSPQERLLLEVAARERAGQGAAGQARHAPQPFEPGVVSDAGDNYRITFTPDGRTAFFTTSLCPPLRCILETHLGEDGRWSTPVLAPFSGTHLDMDPHVTPDGRRLLFSSVRPVDGVRRFDWDTWMVERTADGGWGAPVNLGPAVNSPYNELYASETPEGAFFVASDRPGGFGGWDLYRASPDGAGGHGPLVNLGGDINTPAWEFNPDLSADGRRLMFASMFRAELTGGGASDLYVSHLHRGAWTPARNLGAPVNTEHWEYHPTVSPDGKRLYFVRVLLGSPQGDFFSVEVAKLGAQLRPGFTLGKAP
jgi:hypothetical protein